MGIVASIVSVVTLLSVFVALHFFLRHRRNSRLKAIRQTGVEGSLSLVKPTDTPYPDPQSAQSSWSAIAIINKPTPYPMERYTSRPVSPPFAQSTPNHHALGSYQQMQSLDAATVDLDQILNASVFTSNGHNRPSSFSLPPSTPHLRDVRSSELVRTAEQSKSVTPVSPLSFASNFRDSIIPVGYIRDGSTEGDFGTGNGGGGNATRRSSTIIVSGQKVMDSGGQDGYGDL